jgi:hypothetical protein
MYNGTYSDPRALRCWRMSSRRYATSIFGRHTPMRSTRIVRCDRRLSGHPYWMA